MYYNRSMLPFSSVGESFDSFLRFSVVYAVIILFLIAEIIILPAPFDSIKLVPFLIITIYFWAIYRPKITPPLLVFTFGLLADMISGMPIGLGAIILVLLNWAISSQRAFLSAQSFPMIWVVFGIVYLAIVMFQWFIIGLIDFEWSSMKHIVPQLIAGIIAFPFLMSLYYLIQKILPTENFTLTSR